MAAVYSKQPSHKKALNPQRLLRDVTTLNSSPRQSEGMVLDRRTPRAFSLQGQQRLSAGAPLGWGKHLGGCTQGLMHAGTQHKVIAPWKPGLNPPMGLRETPE